MREKGFTPFATNPVRGSEATASGNLSLCETNHPKAATHLAEAPEKCAAVRNAQGESQTGFTPCHCQGRDTGFTLIELMVVIAIVAVISLVVILTLNPAEILRQSRDANRVSDMSTLRSSLALYLAAVSTPNLASSSGAFGNCYVTFATGTCGFGFSSALSVSTNGGNATSTHVDSTGWLPVDFTQIPSGQPIANLPVDPLNNENYFYSYAATTTNIGFKVVASGMESRKYGRGGSNDAVSNDGGSFPNSYESGTNLSL